MKCNEYIDHLQTLNLLIPQQPCNLGSDIGLDNGNQTSVWTSGNQIMSANKAHFQKIRSLP